MKELIELTEEQQKFCLQNFDKMSLSELAQKAFNDETLDGRSLQGRAIRKFLSKRNLDYKTSRFVPLPEVQLTSEQKEFISNNAATMNALEISKVIFQNDNLTVLNKEAKAVWDYIQTLPPEIVRPQDVIPKGEYQPPKAISRAISKINRFCNYNWKEETLGSRELEGCNALIRYLNSYRFLYMINAYKKEKDRELFESQFISHTFDKPDLNSEFLNGYLNLCAEYVIMANAQEQKEILDERMRTLSQDPDGKMSMSLNEAIANKSEEISQSISRQKSMIQDLVGKRSQLIKNKYDENAVLSNFFEIWKSKKEREIMLKIAEQRKLLIKDEINRLSSLDDFIVKIQGLDPNEIAYVDKG